MFISEDSMQLDLFEEKEERNLQELFIQHIGKLGRRITEHRSEYVQDSHVMPIFNANVVDTKGTKVWFGDVDLAADFYGLSAIVDEYQQEFLILNEGDAVFGKENRTYQELRKVAKVIITGNNLYFPEDRSTKKLLDKGQL